MWIQVRSMDGKSSHKIRDLSKLSKIEIVRQQLENKFEASADRIRLFYRGKQLEDGYTLFDYDVGLNDIIQVLVKPVLTSDQYEQNNVDESKPSSQPSQDADKEKENESTSQGAGTSEQDKNESKFYKVDDLIDAKDSTHGAWFEAKIVNIQKRSAVEENGNPELTEPVEDAKTEVPCVSNSVTDDGLEYHVVFEDYEETGITKLLLKDIRPRARQIIKFDDLKEEDCVMVNYNTEEPKERGYWYDGIVKSIKKRRTVKELIVDIFIGVEGIRIDNCNICFSDEVFAIEKHTLLIEQDSASTSDLPALRQKQVKCTYCKDIGGRKCKYCSCHVCGGKDHPEQQILCDECDLPFHIGCLTPPLTEVPEDDEWYCPLCKNDASEVVKAGEKLKENKKKAKMASANSTSNRDWGKGMACVGRTKECTIVPSNHLGPIPGIEVGTMWKFRVQVSESGVHRPHVAGIHGRENEGAYSIVLSGGYEDDLDDGEEFYYTGSGGRDLSGNKRTAEQSCDQKLTRMNRALAANCAAPINSKSGAEAKNWKDGKPVRVVRNCKGLKHSKYSPEEGNRYDGIYKIVKYWPEKGKSGYLVWRYLLRRDDASPAPWTKEGQKRTKKLGLTMQYPEGFLEKNAAENEKKDKKVLKNNGKKGQGKRSKKASSVEVAEEEEEMSPSPKKLKVASYEIPSDIQKLIEEDTNQKLWNECKQSIADGKKGGKSFLNKVEEVFTCVCCQEVVYRPVTTTCLHNICQSCLRRSFKAEVFSCPMCRHDLGKCYALNVNKTLQEILLKLFPGYDAGR